MKIPGFFILFTIALFLEAVLTTLPITILIFVSLAVIKKEWWLYPLGFFMGILTDILKIQSVGITSILIICAIFLVNSYERKFKTDSIYFVSIASFLFSFIFCLMIGRTGNLLLQSIAGSIVGLLLFSSLKFFLRLSLEEKNRA